METIIDYVQRKLDSFEDDSLNDVDSLVLSQLSYLSLGEACPAAAGDEGVPLRDFHKAELLGTLLSGQRDPEPNRVLVSLVAASPRFRGLRVCLYASKFDEAREEQFAACCFDFPNGDRYVAFRGTDATIVGWKEDFNLAVRYPVPAQDDAAAYLKLAARKPGLLFAGGHSKGGNLAVHAAMNCSDEVRTRLVAVFDHDGPGFSHKVVASPAFAKVSDRVRKTVPQGSIVGMLFESVEHYRVVASRGVGMVQHNPFNWGVDVAASTFSPAVLSASSAFGGRTLGEWLDSLDDAERAQFTESLFSLFSAGEATHFYGEGVVSPSASSVARAFAEADPSVRASLAYAVGMLVKASVAPTASGVATVASERAAEAAAIAGERAAEVAAAAGERVSQQVADLRRRAREMATGIIEVEVADAVRQRGDLGGGAATKRPAQAAARGVATERPTQAAATGADAATGSAVGSVAGEDADAASAGTDAGEGTEAGADAISADAPPYGAATGAATGESL